MTGDAMARPLIEEYERKAATGTPYDGSSLFAISSSAAIFSPPVKKRWMDGVPQRGLHRLRRRHRDRLPGHGHAGQGRTSAPTARSSASAPTASCSTTTTGCSTRPPTSARSAGSAAAASVPVGYYKDPEKSAATFLEIDGERYSVPGDFARIEDGQPGHAARPRLQLRQHRRREGLPRGGGDGDQGPPGRLRLPRGRHPGREVRPGRRRRRRARARAQTLELEELRDFLRDAPVRLQAAALADRSSPRSRATPPARRSTPRAKEMRSARTAEGAPA